MLYVVLRFVVLGLSSALDVNRQPAVGSIGSGNLRRAALRSSSQGTIRRETAKVKSAFQLETELWDGADSVNIESFTKWLPILRAEWSRMESSQKATERSIHVFGLQDSGTNLLTSSLLLNFGPRLRYFDALYRENATGIYGHGIWKHANICDRAKATQEHMEMMRKENVTALIMTREPLSWLQSLRKAPYELEACVTGDDWLQRKCTHPTPAGYGSGMPAKEYMSPSHIWMDWAHAYESWAECGFASALIIRYEDMVQKPQAVLARIASHLGIEAPPYWRIMDTSAKTHGMSIGRAQALLKIDQKEYLDGYQGTDRIEACQYFERDVLFRWNYTDCDGFFGFGWTMWHGGEVPTKSLVEEFLPSESEPAKPKVGIQIFGLQNSGTSLLMSLLMMNFGNRVTYMDSQFPGNGSNSTSFGHGLWRYAKLPQRAAFLHHVANENKGIKRIALTVVRNPITWVESLRKLDFERSNASCLGSCIWGDDWLERPCHHRCPNGKSMKKAGPIYSNLLGVWNAWSRSYSQARKVETFKEVLRIRYEDLVLYPETVLQRISNHIGLAYKTPAKLTSKKPWKKTVVHKQLAGHSHAITELRHGRGNGILSRPQKQAICKQLSPSLMESFGYMDCVKLTGRGQGMEDEAVSMIEAFANTGLR